jgi:DNA-binding transcriptional LysR family regulator
MANEAAALGRKAKGQGAIPAGELGISIPDPSIVDLLPLVAAFRSAYPNVDVNLRSTPAHLPGEMLDRDVRLIFLLTNSPPEDLVGRKLGNLRFVVCRNTDAVDCWIDWAGSPGDILDKEAFVQVQLSVDARQIMTVQSHSHAICAVRAGIGAALLAERAASDGGLHVAGRGPEVGLWMLTHPEFRSDGRVRAMMAYSSSRYGTTHIES